MIVDPSPKLPHKELKILISYFGLSSENQSKEVISKKDLTHILMSWDKGKT